MQTAACERRTAMGMAHRLHVFHRAQKRSATLLAPGHGLFIKALRSLFAPHGKAHWLQLHRMNHQTDTARQRVLSRAGRTLHTLR